MNEGLTKRVQLFIWVHCMPKKESVVTQPFRSKNCPNCAPIEICDLHSSEGIQATVNPEGVYSPIYPCHAHYITIVIGKNKSAIALVIL